MDASTSATKTTKNHKRTSLQEEGKFVVVLKTTSPLLVNEITADGDSHRKKIKTRPEVTPSPSIDARYSFASEKKMCNPFYPFYEKRNNVENEKIV